VILIVSLVLLIPSVFALIGVLTQPPNTGYCGDGICSNVENHAICSVDCEDNGGNGGGGDPVVYCGDGKCSNTETCSSCSGDCGVCPPTQYCGDGVCSHSETCSSCASDCGSCCENECEIGQKFCDGSQILVCGDYDSDPCLEFGYVGCSGNVGACGEYYCEGGECKIQYRPNCCGNDICEYDSDENCRDCSTDCESCDYPAIGNSADFSSDLTCTANNDPTGCLIQMVQSVAYYYGYRDSYEYIQTRMSCPQGDCFFSIQGDDDQESLPMGEDPLLRVKPNYPEKSDWEKLIDAVTTPLSICFSGGCYCADIGDYLTEKGFHVYCSEDLDFYLVKRFTSQGYPVLFGSNAQGAGHAYLAYGFDSNVIRTINPYNVFAVGTEPFCFEYDFPPSEYDTIYSIMYVIHYPQPFGGACLFDRDCDNGLICGNYICQR
jgi:hypothetical protein